MNRDQLETLLSEFKKDHGLYREKFLNWSGRAIGPLRDEVEWCQAEIEERHQKHEEATLFPLAWSHPRTLAGGPFCTLYFDLYLSRDPKALLKKWDLNFAVPADLSRYFNESHPVQIPLSEHLVSANLLNKLLRDWETLGEQNRASLFQDYVELSLNHIKKEEDCFFSLLRSLIPTS